MPQANSKKTVKGKPWKKGQTGNPKGRPRKGASWSELVTELGDKTPDQVREFAASLGRRLPKADMTLKELAVLAAYVDCILEPNPRMLVALMERTEGKPSQAVELSGNSDRPVSLVVRYVDRDVAAAPPRPVAGDS